MLRKKPLFKPIPLLDRHRSDVERILGSFVRRLLELAPVDELNVGHGRPRRLPGVLVLEAAAQSGQHSREIIVESGRGARYGATLRRPE
jgi:hypothetical protein